MFGNFTKMGHNFLKMDPFLTRFAAIETWHSWLANVKNRVKNGDVLRDL